MDHRRDPKSPSTSQDSRKDLPFYRKALGSLLGVRAVLLPSVLLAAALAALLTLRFHPVSGALGAATAPDALPMATAAPPPAGQLNLPALALPVAPNPTPLPTPLPQPTPTPEPYRPLVAPVMPPVKDTGPAPQRKPGAPDPDPSTDHVIVVDGDSGAVLFQRNAYAPVAPASLTKIMTALIGIERGRLDEHVKVDVDATKMDGSSLMGLEPWFDVTFQDLLYGLMLPSGNDAALAIARYVAGSDDAFVQLMNRRAAELGLRCTHFANPHGLDTPDHYSCPADMVTMARYAMQYPLFRKIVATRSYEVRESNIDYTIWNVNPILGYPGADGVKTGFTDNAGRALVATAVRDGHRVYVAFMMSENGAWADGTLLLNWAFDSFTWPSSSPSPQS